MTKLKTDIILLVLTAFITLTFSFTTRGHTPENSYCHLYIKEINALCGDTWCEGEWDLRDIVLEHLGGSTYRLYFVHTMNNNEENQRSDMIDLHFSAGWQSRLLHQITLRGI